MAASASDGNDKDNDHLGVVAVTSRAHGGQHAADSSDPGGDSLRLLRAAAAASDADVDVYELLRA